MSIPACPTCSSEYTYEDRGIFVCPECAHEWNSADQVEPQVCCSNGKVLQSGDTVTVIRDLKVKGSSSVIKVGTKVKNIRILEPGYVIDGHDIDCKVEGFGSIKLKSSVVKKS